MNLPLRPPVPGVSRHAFAAAPREPSVHEGTLSMPSAGLLLGTFHSPRPLRLWLGRHLVIEEAPQRDLIHPVRQVFGAFVVPLAEGEHALRLEAEGRPWHIPFVDHDTRDRARPATLAALLSAFPDELRLELALVPARSDLALALRFEPGQYRRDGRLWQDVWLRRLPGFGLLAPPFPGWGRAAPDGLPALATPLGAEDPAGRRPAWPDRPAHEKRVAVPVAGPEGPPPARSRPEEDRRPEPVRAVVAQLPLELRTDDGAPALRISLPVFEEIGRQAPRRVHHEFAPPRAEDVLAAAPRPRLPAAWAGLERLYESAWRLFCRLWRPLPLESGLPCGHVRTAELGFTHSIFVWDTCFAALGHAHGWRAFPSAASLDCLYSLQQDGGHLERSHDVRDATPVIFEPGFGPNPPLLASAETHLARLTGDRSRLAAVYPALVAQFDWLDHHRRLPDGTYWTSTLAGGLDNSPPEGDGQPDLTAQMAQFARELAWIAERIDRPADAARHRADHARIAAALNTHLWSDALGCYAVARPEGGHDPHKVVTTFWPLWADAVPPERSAALARLAADPATFNRLHPLPSLAADSPLYDPRGGDWRGSVWAPTSAAALRGLWRAGHIALARDFARRHLHALLAVHDATDGRLWENYAPDVLTPGQPAGHGFSWTAANPIALLLEILLGLEPDATVGELRWTPTGEDDAGVEAFALGAVTLSLLERRPPGEAPRVEIHCDGPFTLLVGDARHRLDAGEHRLSF